MTLNKIVDIIVSMLTIREGVDMNIGLEIRSLVNLMVRYTHKLSENGDLSMQQAAIIKHLLQNKDKDTTSKDLEGVFSMRRSTCSRMLTTMQNKDLIMRIDDPVDSRKKLIIPTAKSIGIISSIKSKFDELEEKIRENISKEDLDVFFSVIDQIKQNITVEDEE